MHLCFAKKVKKKKFNQFVNIYVDFSTQRLNCFASRSLNCIEITTKRCSMLDDTIYQIIPVVTLDLFDLANFINSVL